MHSKRTIRQGILTGYAGVIILIGMVAVVAWLQFRWLVELRQEEEARRRVALRVAATHFQERLARDIDGWVERWRTESDLHRADDVPLVSARFAIASGGGQAHAAGAGGWRPATSAELQQQLGRRLPAWIRDRQAAASGLWLAPPALINCDTRCRVGVLSQPALDIALGEAARSAFADFGDELRLAVVRTDEAGNLAAALYPRDMAPGDFRVTDLDLPLLAGAGVLGPPDASWRLWVNHGGGSLQAAVAGSHLRNVMLSVSVLLMLGLAIVLVVLNARRTRQLAEREIFFAASVSHELRTPLSVIGSAADNLADGAVGDAFRVQRYGELIRTETRRLRGMIENVLQFSRSASNVQLQLEKIEANELIAEALRSCEDALEGVDVRTGLADNLPPVAVDAKAMQTVLVNLIRNAAKYGVGESRWIRIVSHLVPVPPRGRALRISVSNPIRGRLDAHPDRLFDAFYRGRNALEAGIVGTGIGLAVARRIARRHGGGLSVDTTTPDVVTFNLYLPVSK